MSHARGARDLRPADGRLAVRPRDDLERGVRPDLRPAEEPLLVRHACRAARRTRTRPRSSGSSQAFPNAKVQTKQEFMDNQIGRPQRDPEHPLRAARAVGDRQPVRDRQHARADRLRADARARDAARGRHDPAAGAADDPPRERDHRADRRRCSGSRSGSCSARCSSPASTSSSSRCRSAQLIVFAVAAIVVGDRRRDLPGAARGAAERPRGAPVRVATWPYGQRRVAEGTCCCSRRRRCSTRTSAGRSCSSPSTARRARWGSSSTGRPRPPVGEAVPDLAPLVAEDELVYVGGPVQQSAVLVLAEFDDPADAAALVVDDVGFVPGDGDFDLLAGATSRRACSRATPAGGRGSSSRSSTSSSWIVERGGHRSLRRRGPISGARCCAPRAASTGYSP